MGTFSGHFWTIYGLARRLVAPSPAVAGIPWETTLEDPAVGTIRLTGRLVVPEGATAAVVLIHGLGGSAEGEYVQLAAAAAAERGLASLRLNLRGADGSGQDIYHAGLTADFHAALASEELAPFQDIYLLGYSLGGHVALSAGCEPCDRRVRGIAAVCAPLDLSVSVGWMDRPLHRPYRWWVLRRLRQVYGDVTSRQGRLQPVAGIERVRRIREWDGLTVCPRFGFRDTADYYAQASVGPRLDRLQKPCLLIAAENDPMVPADSIRPFLDTAPSLLDTRWVCRGGHLGFPRPVQVGSLITPDPETLVFDWFAAQL